ncbi:PfWMP4_16 [Phormidium phage Pf-WMP4]|uniref:PfWMP4_16 n=1 Tax=Phormidium phage Pf-WMP4 TaxID=2913979 RepID=Q0GBV0_9CAUD|nr:PfWMP4_16 [Phormidium phage Pf-WMP4]ABI33160.1 PfWMP4_16 [Phormidium phage Pf-WMP4]
MALSEYTDEELKDELIKRQVVQPKYMLNIQRMDDNLFVSYGDGQKWLVIEHGATRWDLRPEELRQLSIMVSTVRHNGKQEKTNRKS